MSKTEGVDRQLDALALTWSYETAREVATSLTCGEVDVLVDLLRAKGRHDLAQSWLSEHAASDDGGDAHYALRDDSRPPSRGIERERRAAQLGATLLARMAFDPHVENARDRGVAVSFGFDIYDRASIRELCLSVGVDTKDLGDTVPTLAFSSSFARDGTEVRTRFQAWMDSRAREDTEDEVTDAENLIRALMAYAGIVPNET